MFSQASRTNFVGCTCRSRLSNSWMANSEEQWWWQSQWLWQWRNAANEYVDGVETVIVCIPMFTTNSLHVYRMYTTCIPQVLCVIWWLLDVCELVVWSSSRARGSEGYWWRCCKWFQSQYWIILHHVLTSSITEIIFVFIVNVISTTHDTEYRHQAEDDVHRDDDCIALQLLLMMMIFMANDQSTLTGFASSERAFDDD